MKTKIFWTFKEKELICKEAVKICFGNSKQIPVPFARGMLLDVGLKAQLVLPVERRREGPITTFKFVEEYLLEYITKPGNVTVEKPEQLASEIDRLDADLRTKVAGLVAELLVKSPLFKEVVNTITSQLSEEIMINLKVGNNLPREDIVIQEKPVAQVRVVSSIRPAALPTVYVLNMEPKQLAAIKERAPYVVIESLTHEQCKNAHRHQRKLVMADLILYNDFTAKAMKELLKDLREEYKKDSRKTRNSESGVLFEIESKYKPAVKQA